MRSTTAGDLAGLTAVVTRPRHQAAGLATQIERHGGRAFRFPVIEIGALQDPRGAARLAAYRDYDWLVFVSANAVEYGWRRLRAGPVVKDVQVAAIGPATARALERAGLRVDLVAAGANSESLLAAAQPRGLAGQRVLIVRGEGGRETLRAGLERLGAKAEYAEVYQRKVPNADLSELTRELANAETLVTVVTSVAGLRNLLSMLDPELATLIREHALLVIGPRQTRAAHEENWRGPVLTAENAADTEVISVLKRWYARNPKRK